VAKVTVEKSSLITQTGVPGTLDNLQFAINNFNEKLFLMQGAAPTYKDPNWSVGSYSTADFSQAITSDYVAVNNAGTATADYNARYASENTSDGKTKGEITRATIRATFIPATVRKYKNNVDNSEGYVDDDAHGVAAPQTFYAVTPSLSIGTIYFFDQAIANAYASDNALSSNDVQTYTNGYCYYDLFLNKNNGAKGLQWDVVRNEYFKCTITSIVAPGRPTPEITDPGTPPDGQTNLTVDIDVLFWNTPVLADYDLVP
jgi:hypothetical protein